jgi:hypothetical protein
MTPAIGIGIIVALDIVGLLTGHISVGGFQNWGSLILVFMAALSFLCSRRFAHISEWLLYMAAWSVFTMASVVLTYIAGSMTSPLVDNSLAKFDAAIGFNWLAWYEFVTSIPWLNSTLDQMYNADIPIMLVSIAIFAMVAPRRNFQMMWAAILALFATAGLFALFPSMGPPVYFDLPNAVGLYHYVGDMVQLRSTEPASFTIHRMGGIVPFPSFHAVLAVLFIYYNRGLVTFYPVTIVCTIMWVSAMVTGAHYLTDLLAGTVLATVAICLASQLSPPAAIPNRNRATTTDVVIGGRLAKCEQQPVVDDVASLGILPS